MKLLLAGILAATALFSTAPAHADPSSDCTLRNTQLCGDHSAVHYCPGGGFVSAFSGVCPGLVNGLTPPLPGGLPSSGGSQ
jgi:hypothetical protein